jgi:hypothetical protein
VNGIVVNDSPHHQGILRLAKYKPFMVAMIVAMNKKRKTKQQFSSDSICTPLTSEADRIHLMIDLPSKVQQYFHRETYTFVATKRTQVITAVDFVWSALSVSVFM